MAPEHRPEERKILIADFETDFLHRLVVRLEQLPGEIDAQLNRCIRGLRASTVSRGVSMRIGNDEFAERIRWIRSYVVREPDDTLGTVCIYQAASADAIREHAARVGMPADEISPVERLVVIRKDPESVEEEAA